MKNMFDKINIGNLKLNNRFVRSATWEAMATEDGQMTPELLKVYEELSKNEVGLIITGYANILEEERPNPKMMGIYNDDFIEQYLSLTETVHDKGSKIIMQIVYGGTNTRNPKNKLILGPSSIPHERSKLIPQEATKDDIKMLIHAFRDAALRAKKSNFDGIMLHVAHGYLLSQWLDPYYNKRTDEYGGSLEKRARLIIEVYKEVRKAVGPEYPITIKINASDYKEGHSTLEDTIYVLKELEKRGLDAAELSGGNIPKEYRDIKAPEDYFVKEHKIISEHVNIPFISVGGHRELSKMNEFINESGINMISMARPFLAEPDLVINFKNGQSKSKCISCNGCFTKEHKECIVYGKE